MVFTTYRRLSFIVITMPSPPYFPSVSRIDLLKLSLSMYLEYGSKEPMRPVTAAISSLSLPGFPSDSSSRK